MRQKGLTHAVTDTWVGFDIDELARVMAARKSSKQPLRYTGMPTLKFTSGILLADGYYDFEYKGWLFTECWLENGNDEMGQAYMQTGSYTVQKIF